MGRRYFMTEQEKESLALLLALLSVMATIGLGIIIFAPLKVTLFIFGTIFSLIFFWVLFVTLGMMVGGKVGAVEVKDEAPKLPNFDITSMIDADLQQSEMYQEELKRLQGGNSDHGYPDDKNKIHS